MILEDKEFQNARIIIYSILFIFYIYLAYFSNFECSGCSLCGMTRAVKCLFLFHFYEAFQYNSNVWIFCILIPIIAIDILGICYFKLKNYYENHTTFCEVVAKSKNPPFSFIYQHFSKFRHILF